MFILIHNVWIYHVLGATFGWTQMPRKGWRPKVKWSNAPKKSFGLSATSNTTNSTPMINHDQHFSNHGYTSLVVDM
jgi:hypothetical protein